jgi:glycosyltransferase involved in cell wall biosynthesis
MRVLHAPVNIGNQPWVLSRYERKLGIESDFHITYEGAFGYCADKVISKVGDKSAMELRKRLVAGLRAPLEYDVFHFYFGKTLLCWDDYLSGDDYRYLDFEIARRLAKPVFFTLQGCDVRIAGESTKLAFTPCRSGACGLFSSCLSKEDKKRRQFLSEILPKADRVFYLNPELSRYVAHGEFLPYSSVDIEVMAAHPPKNGGRPTIVHAPSDPSIKGTPLILEALEALRKEWDFELVLVQNMPHEQALEIYRTADIVIDQVLSGWYGGFAVEAMAMGKPVMCYLRHEDFECVPDEMLADLPIVDVRPDHLAEDIATVLDRRSEWGEWSDRSRCFADKWHNPRTIAEAMIELYEDPSTPMTILQYIADRAAAGADHGPFNASAGIAGS